LLNPVFGGTSDPVFYVVGPHQILMMGSDGISNDAISFLQR
jgi:hypothetical protein